MAVRMTRWSVVCALSLGVAAGSTFGQAAFGPRAGAFPDIIVSSVGGSYDTTGNSAILIYGASGGVGSYAIGSDSCNIGAAPGIWIDAGTYQNQHPVIGGQIYRLFNGRFEQIGSGWLKHGFCAADSCSSGNSSGGQQGCLNVGGNPPGRVGCATDYNPPGFSGMTGCDWLGAGRATDTYTASLNGGQGYLGPRSEVNPWTGQYPYPYIKNGSNPVSCLNKRLLVRKSDLDPANYPRYDAVNNPQGAQYFAEVAYIMTDQWPGERYNDYSYRRLVVGNLVPANASTGSNICTAEQTYSLNFATGPGNLTVPMKPAIEAWKQADPTVRLVFADAPNDGRFYVGCKVTDRGDGTWQYEYAVMNMNSARGAGSFMVPKANSPSVQITEMDMRTTEQHSGEAFSQTKWAMANEAGGVSFTTDTFENNAMANAIRWSNTYNFRFVSNRAPVNGSVRIGLFGPAVNSGDANFLNVAGVQVPSNPPSCPADFNAVGGVTTADIFDFVNAWFSGDTAADFDRSNDLTAADIFDFLNAWFAGCP
ncbi:MAG: hypothetical protein K2W85_17180 [Phycisphaerales bacterium]|nr:hypothetical protein [Phycisphaerales bacterium]